MAKVNFPIACGMFNILFAVCRPALNPLLLSLLKASALVFLHCRSAYNLWFSKLFPCCFCPFYGTLCATIALLDLTFQHHIFTKKISRSSSECNIFYASSLLQTKFNVEMEKQIHFVFNFQSSSNCLGAF